MEKERQGPRPPSGRGPTRGTTLHPERRTPAASTRPRVTPARPYRPAAGRQRPAAPPPPLHLSAQSRRASASPLKSPSDERFRDALWPETRDTSAQRRTAFLLSLLYALIHVVCSALSVHPLNVLTARMPFPVADIIRAFLPALAGAALCGLARLPLSPEPRMMLQAYRKLLREVLLIFIALQVLIWGEWEAQRLLAQFVIMFVAPPLIVGTALAALLFYLDWLYIEVDDEDA